MLDAQSPGVDQHRLFPTDGMYICIYVYMCICIYVYMYICIYSKGEDGEAVRGVTGLGMSSDAWGDW